VSAESLLPSNVRPIRFVLNSRVVEVRAVAPTTNVLSYLRGYELLTGTKEGCAEGDCGACTVVVGDICNGELRLNAVNACIQLLPTLDGKALFTVEALRQPDGSLHPVQEAMVACHGSQCGFCTPGFVMSFWALYLAAGARRPGESEIRASITGNLCRCTGYRPIIEAGRRMFDLKSVEFDRQALHESLRRCRSDESLHYQFGGRHFFAPRTVDDLVRLRAALPKATIVAGSTDVGLWVNKELRDIGDVIYTGEVAELKFIDDAEDVLTIGAAVSLSDASRAFTRYWPEFDELWERFASLPIRNAATLGGNIANGSPIGDSMPALLALGATLLLVSSTGSRSVGLEAFYRGYKLNAMVPNEVIESVSVMKPVANSIFRTYKVSKRFDSDISAVCAAFFVQFDGETIASCRLAFGGMAAVPMRAGSTEALLAGRKWDESVVQSAMDALAADFSPLSDMRATAAYRMAVARNLLYRFWLESRTTQPLPAHEVSVFALPNQQ